MAYGNNNAITPASNRNIIGVDPLFTTPFANQFLVTGSRIDPQLVSVTINRPNPPEGIAGDYHLGSDASPARNAGLTNTSPSSVAAPTVDFDNQGRTQPYDLGADER